MSGADVDLLSPFAIRIQHMPEMISADLIAIQKPAMVL
jgi:hypothetical protein